jgi:signal transduction histidine kinase
MLLNGRKLLREGTQTKSLLLAFEDITERKRSERQLKENECRQAALVAIGDQMRQTGDIQALIGSSLQIVVNALGVSRAGYGTVDAPGEYLTIESDCGDGTVSSIVGRYRLEDYGDGLSGRFLRGEIISIPDVRTNPTTARDSDRWEALQIRAAINVPLLEHGRFSAMLFLHSSTARIWTESDLNFVRKAVDRIWSAVERDHVLEELKASEEFTRSILASSPDFVTVMDLDGRLITTGDGSPNAADAARCGSDSWFQGWGESKDQAEAALAAARQGQTTRFEAVRPSLKRSSKWWEVVVAPIYDGTAKPVRILSLAREITERKCAEQERERLTGELKRSNEELLDFAHIVAHDLQSPLRAVSGFAKLVHRNARERLAKEDGELLEGIVDSSRRMERLVDSLLRYAQVGKGELERARVDMNEVLEAALGSLQIQLEEQDAAVIREGTLPAVMGDSVQLVQLLQNLIGNALKYARPGVQPLVRVSFVEKDGTCIFSVADNGEGIEIDYRAQIFQPLKRLHGSDIPGTGLGLAICERIVKRHGGRIWVESDLNSGSTFYFSLPAGSPLT